MEIKLKYKVLNSTCKDNEGHPYTLNFSMSVNDNDTSEDIAKKIVRDFAINHYSLLLKKSNDVTVIYNNNEIFDFNFKLFPDLKYTEHICFKVELSGNYQNSIGIIKSIVDNQKDNK